MKSILNGLLSFFVFACPLWAQESLQMGTSVSHFYEARSTFVNPAALAYQSQLNGTGLLSSFSWAWQSSPNEFGVGLSWGNWGLGLERERYSLASSLAFGPYLFGGTRIVWNGNRSPQLDLGLQIRPNTWIAGGILANQTQTAVGLTLRPLESLMLQADFETPTEKPGSRWNTQLQALWELRTGLSILGGYANEKKTYVGFQLDLGRTSLFTVGQSQPAERAVVSHAQFAFYQKPSAFEGAQALHLKIDGDLEERGEVRSFFSLGTDSFSEVLWKIKKCRENNSVKTIYLELESFPLGMGAASELFEALWKARQSGKKIHVSLGNARLKEYLIASVAHQIALAPSGSLELLGPKSERYYLKGTLERVGIEAEMVAKGAYKSAPEMFTQKKASEKSRENIFATLKEAEAELTEMIQRSGRISAPQWKKARELGVLSNLEALELKLIDRVADAPESFRQIADEHHMRSSLQEGSSRLALKPKIALVIAEGDIIQKKFKWLGLVGSSQITPEQVREQLEQVVNDPLIEAVVFRISSGGGDVLASQLIANQLKVLNSKKPVVISMGDVAASGGYFLSVPASSVYASPLTLTGSIGVFAGKPSFEALYKKIDLQKEILTLAPFPGLYDEARRWSLTDRAVIERQVNHYYKNFVDFVAVHRKLATTEVERFAQGRVWLGRKAQQLKLVDALGGPIEAFEKARDLAGLKDFEIKIIYPKIPFFESLNPLSGVSQSVTPLLKELKPALLSDQPLLYWSSETLR